MSLFGSDGRPVTTETSTGHLAVERRDAASLSMGRVVQYVFHGPRGPLFTIGASRNGIEMSGVLPPLTTQGMVGLFRVMRRMIRLFETMSATPVGQAQLVLTEEELDAMEQADAAPAVESSRPTAQPADVLAFPGNGLPHEQGV